ncbi:MAG TPA: Ig-like domain-containing protein, partial [Thermoanaerobaculia bacterium]|nr:Ig-like domain-containing protein [Thermoanaerobaculia bacterium]
TPFGDPLEATTGPDGGFLFPLVPFGLNNHVVFSGSLSGVDRWAEARVGVTAASPRARVTLRVVPVGEVTVRVVTNASSGVLPVAGAQVRVEETEGPRRGFDGTTDVEGIALFSGVSAGPIAVRARKDLVAGRGSALGAGEGFRVDAVVALAQTAEVTGIVRRPSDGTGLAGVNVLVDAGPWKGMLGAATTDAEGRFFVEGLPGGDGTVYRIRAEDPRTLRGGSSPVFVLSAGEVKDFDLMLRGIGSVTGVLRTFDGTRALAGAEVDISSHAEDGHDSPALRVSTGEDGRYRTDGVPEGTILVRARVPLSGLSARATGLLSGEGATLTLDLSASPTGRVRGAVLSASGNPLPAGGLAPEVRLDAGATRETLLSAEYDFVEVDATEPLLLQASERVEPFHGGLLRGRALAGQTVVANVRYAAFGTLRVRVVKPDPEHHGLFLPAPGIVVLSCGEPYAYRFPCGAPVRTDAAGKATFPNVGGGAPGRLVATEEATGARGVSGVAPFSADGETRDVTVVVEPRGLVRGRLLLPAGAGPAGDASVVLQQQDLRGFWITAASTVSGDDGRFELQDVGFGGLVLRAETTTGPLARAELALSISAATPVVDTGELLFDGQRPQVVFLSPSDGASGVGLTPALEATFSEPLGAALHGRRPQEFVELSGPYGTVPAIVTLDAGNTVLRIALTNGASLAGATTYQLRILGSLPDRSGLTLGGDVVVHFTTADLTAPTVLTSAPLPGQIQVATDVNPVVVFTKALDPATVASGVRLERRDAPQGPAACAPALRADGRTVALNPGSPLAEEADYEIVVDGVADTAGNHLPSTVRIPFLTRDDHAPVVTLDVPATSTPLEGSSQAFTLRFVDDDMARVRLTIVAATGPTTCGENDPGPSVRAISFSCRLPLISAAGGTSVVVRAEGGDRSGNSALPADRALTLAPDAPPVLTVTSPTGGARFLSGTTVRVVGSVEEDNG